MTSHDDKAEALLDFYTNLIGTSQPRGRSINLDALGIRPHFQLWKCGTLFSFFLLTRSPDLMGSPVGFINLVGPLLRTISCWPLTQSGGGILRNFRFLNSAYITLLPKKESIMAKDFRPITISLIHSFAKLLTKVLANRLRNHMDEIVYKNQSAFIKGRFIQDNFMLVHQTARFLHAQKQPRILLN